MNLVKDLCYVVLLVGVAVATVRILAEWSGILDLRWAGVFFIACAAALSVWMVLLGITLPAEVTARHWSTAWVGIDAMEACCLTATGMLTLKRDSRVGAVAGAAAALLAVDAWFDITTAQTGSDYLFALLLGCGIEMPLAAVCALIAWNAPQRFTALDAQRAQSSMDARTRKQGPRRAGRTLSFSHLDATATRTRQPRTERTRDSRYLAPPLTASSSIAITPGTLCTTSRTAALVAEEPTCTGYP